jgi:diguanylate cyclase (GGDEF)-like protein
MGLERHNREMTELSQLSELIQTCENSTEAHGVIERIMPLLFPNEAGAVSLLNESRNLIETAAVWGGATATRDVTQPKDCWAMRRGKIHQVGQDNPGPYCSHLRAPYPVESWCVPMIAQGDALGVLHLRIDAATDREGGPHGGNAELRRLLTSVAERLALSLANLRLRESLYRQSVRDAQTGLYNRRYLEETLEREFSRAVRSYSPLALIIMDIDHFKKFNDRFGHGAGDSVLREIAAMLKKKIRHEDIACRYGGEEFVLALPGMSAEMALERAEMLRQEIAGLEVRYRDETLGRLSCSFGLAVFPDHGQTTEALIDAADTALYRAKGEGRDRVCVADAAAAPEDIARISSS